LRNAVARQAAGLRAASATLSSAMVLLNRMIRNVAITGRTDNLNVWVAGRQGGRWAEQTIRAAFPEAPLQAQRTPPAVSARPPADPAETLRQLTELHRRGIVTDAEFETLRAGQPV
jgi:hypothetical protein